MAPGAAPTRSAPQDGYASGPAGPTHPTGPIPQQPPQVQPPQVQPPDLHHGPNGTAVGGLAPVVPDAPGAPGEPAPADPDEVDDADADADAAGVEDIDDDRAADGWALVHAAQDGDTEAFGRLFDRYHDVVFRFVLFRLNDRQAAEDLTQETFVRAYRRITSVSYQGRDIGAWFVTIARNLVLDHVKSSRYRLESATPEVADVAPTKSQGPGPEQEVIAGATHAELLRCVARLGDDQQECITLRFLQGLSVAETAEIMGRNEGAVKALQHRAVRRLAQLLPEGLR